MESLEQNQRFKVTFIESLSEKVWLALQKDTEEILNKVEVQYKKKRRKVQMKERKKESRVLVARKIPQGMPDIFLLYTQLHKTGQLSPPYVAGGLCLC